MRRKLAVAAVAAGLFSVAACGGGGGQSNQEVCEKVDADGTVAAERFAGAGDEIRVALQAQDQAAALVAVSEAQNAASDLVDILRDGADSAEDDELSLALTDWADELEALVGGLDPVSLMEGEQPDASGMEAAATEVENICDAA